LWLNDRFSQVIVMAPVDDENTVQYVRFYQRAVTAPGLGQIIAYLGNLYNLHVLREDKEIILSQRPKKADLNVGERFIPGDRPIALYLKHRRDLMLATRRTEAFDPVHHQEATLHAA
jgi:hypothetical protein